LEEIRWRKLIEAIPDSSRSEAASKDTEPAANEGSSEAPFLTGAKNLQ
jgi:hypothetical protein